MRLLLCHYCDYSPSKSDYVQQQYHCYYYRHHDPPPHPNRNAAQWNWMLGRFNHYSNKYCYYYYYYCHCYCYCYYC